jgi:hypothetical protein
VGSFGQVYTQDPVRLLVYQRQLKPGVEPSVVPRALFLRASTQRNSDGPFGAQGVLSESVQEISQWHGD